MIKINVLDISGNKVSDITLSENVFGITPHQQALFDVVNAQKAAMRQGTHKVKDRSEVRGGGKKPWRQKGTGRARHGSRRSPIWVGGGTTFGPTPRSYAMKINRKVRKLAFRSALSHHVLKEQLMVINELKLADHRTKSFLAVLSNLKLEGKTLIVTTELDDNLILASRNLNTAMMALAQHVSVYDLLDCKNLVLTETAIKHFEEVLGNE